MKTLNRQFYRRLMTGVATSLLAVAFAGSVLAQPRTFNVPAGDLKAALDGFIAQSGVSLIYRVEDVKSRNSPGVKGTMEPDVALRQLLSGANLTLTKDESGAFVLSKATASIDAATEPTVIEEVIVTAEKRSSAAQRTAIAMDVFDANALKRNGVASLQDLANVSPSIQFSQNQAASVITIRGVASRDDSEVGDPAVAVSVDGFYVQRPVGLNATMFDLERIEALRGPQGTLYGRNATGGAINIISKKPTYTFGASAMADIGNFNTQNFEGMINVPLSSIASLRVSGAVRSHDGYLKRTPVPDADDEDSEALRAHLLIEPTDRLTILLTADFLKQTGVGSQGVGVPMPTDGAGNPTRSKPGIPDADTEIYSDLAGYTNVSVNTYKWNVAYSFDPVTLTYLGGSSKMTFHRLGELDATEGYFEGFQQNEAPKTINHELRLSSNGDGAFKWQAGAFYFKEDNALRTYLQTYTGDVPFNWGVFDFPEIVAESKAVFAQGSYRLTPTVTAEAGIRYTEDEKSRIGSLSFYGFGIPEDSQESSIATTWHLGLNWQRTPVNLVYAKADRGYKAGGFNNGSTYDPEFLTAYEIGSKNQFFDRRLQLNLTAFYYDYSNQQVKQNIATEEQSIIREIVSNAGSSELFGLEADGIWLATPDDRFDFSVGLLHAEYTRFDVSDGNGGNDNLAGNQMQQAPKTTITGGYQHTWPLTAGDLTARLQSRYQSAMYLSSYNYAFSRQDAYTKTDASLSYTPSGGHYTLQAYVRNIENERVINVAVENLEYDSIYYQLGAPRTYGVRLTANW
ncbi:TonB-dependent receptor domain-containing protein [Asticcacaulis endophyticus]|uniref:TonB-dependent receptor n=1 Tax=Asticcacaulis endophyticus TaxID=1395890 RepID=A0A918UZE9_9CAUL|nr:TonB-dependent receptor [Asticcacaulis endophyticus]GGZ45054.1 TonB-dependent receptor [Asticcacaulis endophyticus]